MSSNRRKKTRIDLLAARYSRPSRVERPYPRSSRIQPGRKACSRRWRGKRFGHLQLNSDVSAGAFRPPRFDTRTLLTLTQKEVRSCGAQGRTILPAGSETRRPPVGESPGISKWVAGRPLGLTEVRELRCGTRSLTGSRTSETRVPVFIGNEISSNPSAAHNNVALVKHRRLSRSDCPLCLLEGNQYFIVADLLDESWRWLVAMTNFDADTHRLIHV